MLIDSHVHVGWYSDGYHSPQEVLKAEGDAGVTDICVSSTSTCAELYKLVVREMKELKRLGGMHVHPILWISPRMMKTWGIRYMLHSHVRWEGVKMHWHAHREWYYNHKLTEQALDVARRLGVPVLLHTGLFKECYASVFKPMIQKHSDLTFVLAHGQPIDETIDILRVCPNAWVDTAFMPKESLQRLKEAHLLDRTLFGTDAPINLVYRQNISTDQYLRGVIKDYTDIIGLEDFHNISSRTIFKHL